MKYIQSQQAPAPVGPYSHAVMEGNLIFCSGQVAIDPGTGKLAGTSAAQQTEHIITNLQAVLKEAGASLQRVVKVTLYLKNMGDIAAVNEVYARHFGEHKPARSTVEVTRLPKGALVEMDCIAIVSG